MEPVIKVTGLGKQYHIGGQKKTGRTLVETLTDSFKSPFARRNLGETNSFWALRDVNFEINAGEVVGIIGRNGAGKSTLLKILSRITDPTEGEIDITGRVGSLLEVGTGFHPELSGRENVYLNGAILGMKKEEITKKFGEIVAFAETEKFLDTPVKYYSSGMYTRLAFAVAAHLDPEILIVDEVLAVGDVEFQRKCMGKMQDVAGQGRTVLFVSHNIPAVRALCTSAILLAAGRVELMGQTADVLDQYLSRHARAASGPISYRSTTAGLGLTDVYFVDAVTGNRTDKLTFGSRYELRLELIPAAAPVRGAVAVTILDAEGNKVSTLATVEEGLEFFDLSRTSVVRFAIPNVAIMPGSYRVWVDIGDQHVNMLTAESACEITVDPHVLPGAAWPYGRAHGVCRVARGAAAGSAVTAEFDGIG
jgi:lipopolysaccharide transport system ATP-binding protein